MSIPDLAPLVAAAAQTIVRAMSTPAWPGVRNRFAGLLAADDPSRLGPAVTDLDAARAALLAGQHAPGAEEARLRGQLDVMLAARPDLAGAVGAAVNEARAGLNTGPIPLVPATPAVGTPMPPMPAVGTPHRHWTIAIAIGMIAVIAIVAAVAVSRTGGSSASDTVRAYFTAADRGDSDAMAARQCERPHPSLLVFVASVRSGLWESIKGSWSVQDERALSGGAREVAVSWEIGRGWSSTDKLYLRVVRENGAWRLCELADAPFDNDGR